MKHLFCNLKIEHEKSRQEPHSVHLPYGLGIIMDVFDKMNQPYFYVDTYLNGLNRLFESLKQEQFDVVYFSAIVGNHAYPFLKNIFSRIKSISESTVIVLGGPITSIYPDICLKELQPDLIVIGEGEITVQKLVDINFDKGYFSKIDGIGFLNSGGEAELTKPRQPLPSPLETHSHNPSFSQSEADKTHRAYVSIQKAKQRGYDLSASRGCVGKCTFCKRVFDKPIRYFSAEHVVNFMEDINKKFGISKFSFLDENFIANKRNFTCFLDLLEERNLNFRWRLRSRVDFIPSSLVDRMINLGLYSIMIGLESASQEVLDNYAKGITIHKYVDTLRYLGERDLLFVSLILGSEVESQHTIQENIAFLNSIKLHRKFLNISYLSVIPGTDIFTKLVSNGRILSISDYLYSYQGDFSTIEMNISPMSDQELLEGRQSIYSSLLRQ